MLVPKCRSLVSVFSRFFLSIALVILCFIPRAAQAFVLDWNAVDWTQTWSANPSGTMSQTFNNVNASGVNITIQIERGPNTGATEPQNTANLPNDTTSNITHNWEPTQEALMVDVDYTSATNDFVRFTITFSQTVYNVNFDLWDIDLGNSGGSTYQDVIRNFTATGGAAPVITALGSGTLDGFGENDVDVSIQGTGTNQVVYGISTLGSTTSLGNEDDAFNSGDVNVNYNGAGVTSVRFEYWSGTGSFSGVSIPTNNTLQRISLADINFSDTPEVLSGFGALAACAAVLMRRRPRRIVRD